MDTSSSGTITPRRTLAVRIGRPGIVIATVVIAVVANLLIFAIGASVGATYEFTSEGQPARVDTITLVGFTALPLAVGMTIAAILSRLWRWVVPVALFVTLVLGLGSIVAMPLQTDLDAASKTALSLCHVALTLAGVAGLLALRSLGQRKG